MLYGVSGEYWKSKFSGSDSLSGALDTLMTRSFSCSCDKVDNHSVKEGSS